MELATANLSEGNESAPEAPAAEPRQLFGIGVDNFITLVVFGLIFALGVLGNSLVITVLARSKPGKPRSTTNLFILNLSIADLAYLLFCIPFQATVYALPTWVLGAFICKFTHYFFTVSMLVSIFTLVAMSVDRYVAIVHSRRSSSLRVSRNALLGVGLIWALSIAMASPVAYHQSLFHRDLSNQTFCWDQWPNKRHKKAYVVCTFVFGYLLPLLLICFCYAKVGAERAGQSLGVSSVVCRAGCTYQLPRPAPSCRILPVALAFLFKDFVCCYRKAPLCLRLASDFVPTYPQPMRTHLKCSHSKHRLALLYRMQNHFRRQEVF
uniref:G-protein coupled receptors family 1 profile domain-containing protein n=1 Tax=Castor canadensis TaxID=51338 RepID=A0A8C0WQ21_CASCN